MVLHAQGKRVYGESGTLPATSDASAADAKEADTIRQYWSLLVGRFRNVSRFSYAAKLEKTDRIKIGGEKIECYVVKFQTEDATDEMWVDKDRFIVWRLKQTPKVAPDQPAARNVVVTVNLTVADVNSSVDDGLFRFTPPEDAKRVAALKWPDKKPDKK